MSDLDRAILGLRQAVENQREHPDEDHSDAIRAWRTSVLNAQRSHTEAFFAGQSNGFIGRTR